MSWMFECNKTGTKPMLKEVAPRRADRKAYWGQVESLQVCHGLLCRKKCNDGEKRGVADRRRVWVQVLVPLTLGKDVLHVIHNAVTVGHLGTRMALMVIQLRLYWPQMKKFVCEWCWNHTRCSTRMQPRGTRTLSLELCAWLLNLR